MSTDGTSTKPNRRAEIIPVLSLPAVQLKRIKPGLDSEIAEKIFLIADCLS